MSRISVILISYNEKDYLKRAINSCMVQTCKDVEIIIGDDGSNDGSIEVIKNLGGGVTYFVMPRNSSEKIIPSIRVSNIIRRGLEVSTGDYILILSADDYFIDEHKFQDAIDFLDIHDDYYAYVSGYDRVSDEGKIDSIAARKTSPHFYWSGHYLHISCFIFRKLACSDLLDRFYDDTGLEFVLATKGKWAYCEKSTFAYYQRNTSIMHSSDETELALLDMMIYQDIKNYHKSVSRKLLNATRSRMYSSYRTVLKNRQILSGERYAKYIEICRQYDNDLVGKLIDCNSSSSIVRLNHYLRLYLMMMYRVFYSVLRRMM